MSSINQYVVSLLFVVTFTSSVSASNLTVEMTQQALIGGGHIIVNTTPGSEVNFMSQSVLVDADGYVAVGFGRDVSGIQRLTVTQDDGTDYVQDIVIEDRTYKEQRIEGINPAQVNPPQEVLDRIIREAKQVREARAYQSNVSFWRTDRFIKPLEGRVTGVYGSQRFYNGEARSPHWGIDYAAPQGSSVSAPAGGIVRLAEDDLYYSGGTLVLDHGGGLTSSFLHLSKLLVTAGDQVSQGDVIAEVGSTGRSTGPHLDWRMNLHGERIDAALWLLD